VPDGYVLKMTPIVFGAVFALVAVVTVRRVIVSRDLKRGQIECAWRGFDSPGKWRHGLATVSHGSLEFQPRLAHTRIPNGTPVSVVVESIDSDDGRRPSLSQICFLDPRLHILTVRTPRGPIEIAVMPKRASTLRARLGI
jgi:Protein of unknown function (DUF2550)